MQSLLQSFKWFQAILTSYHISPNIFAQIPNHGLGLRQGWNFENSRKSVWLAQIDFFHERKHTRSFLQSFKWFQVILTSYHISPNIFAQIPNHGLGLRQGWNFENSKKWVRLTQNDFFHERKHTLSFLQSFKRFQAIFTIHHISPNIFAQIPNHGLGLRQGWNFENSRKSVWLAQIDFFHERKHTRSFLQSFKWFQVILTSYHISPNIFAQIPNHGLGLRQGWNFGNSKKWVRLAQNDFFHERKHTLSFLQSFKWFQAILASYHISPNIFA